MHGKKQVLPTLYTSLRKNLDIGHIFQTWYGMTTTKDVWRWFDEPVHPEDRVTMMGINKSTSLKSKILDLLEAYDALKKENEVLKEKAWMYDELCK